MSFGTGTTGGMAAGGASASTAAVPITLYSSIPVSDATGVAQNAGVVFTLEATYTVDPLSIDVVIEGEQAILGGIFQTGFTGTIVQNGTQAVVTFLTHLVFDQTEVDILIKASDGNGDEGSLTLSYSIAVGVLSALRATSYPEGKQINLTWTNPAGVSQMRIYRSTYAFVNFESDPADLIYEGAPVSLLDDTALEEDTFYYYTIQLSYTATAPYSYVTSDSGKVTGLSVTDYAAEEGHYVYNLFPRNYRQRDGEPARGDNRYLLRDYSDFMQASINTYRGWFESLLRVKDPETAPAGRLGEAENQRGILKAHVASMGVTPEETWDAGVLRRVASGIVAVYKKKGTCQGYLDLTKVVTTWDSRCISAIDPVCGINRLFRVWDGESSLRWARGNTADPINTTDPSPAIDSTTPGTLIVSKAFFWDQVHSGNTFLPTQLTPNSLHLRSDLGVQTAAGIQPDHNANVDTWVDQSAKGNDAVQAVDVDRYKYQQPGTDFEGRPSLRNQSSSFHTVQSTAGTNFIGNNSATFFFVVAPLSLSAKRTLLSIENGPLECLLRGTAAADYGFVDTTGEVTFGVATKSYPHALSMSFNADTLEAKLYVDNQLLATVAYAPPTTLANDIVILGDVTGGTGAYFDRGWGEVFVADRVVTDFEMALMWGYLAARYEFPFGLAGAIPLTASGEDTVVSILTSLGDFACVSGVTEDSTHYTFTYETPTAYLRAEISGDATRIDAVSTSTYDIDSIDTTHYAWQFLLPADAPLYNADALVGMTIMFDTLATRTIVAQDATDPVTGKTRITVNVAGPSGTNAFSLADAYTTVAASLSYANRVPITRLTFLIGEHSFIVDPLWDTRLMAETVEGPWSMLTGLGATTSGVFVPSPADVTVFVENQDAVIGTVVTTTTNTMQDTSQAWLINEWVGFFLLANWNQTKLFRIVGNTPDTLYVLAESGGVDSIASVDSTYVILSEENALKYRRLTDLLSDFSPFESRPYVKFEEVAATLRADFFADCALWVRADNGLVISDVATPNGLQEWLNHRGSLGGLFAINAHVAPDAPTADTIGTVVAYEFGVTEDHALTYDGAAADFSFLHNGEGCTFGCVVEDSNTGYVFATNDGSSTSIGMNLYRTATHYRLRVSNGSADVVDVSVPVTSGGISRIIIRMKLTGVVNQVDFSVNGVSTTASFTGTPSAADPAGLATINDATTNGTPFRGKNAEVFAYTRYLLNYEADRLTRSLTAIY